MTDQEAVDELFVRISPSERLRLWDYFQSFIFPHRDVRAELARRVALPDVPPPLPKERVRIKAVGKSI